MMEEKLLWIGLGMGAFAWLLRRALRGGAAPRAAAALHGAFCALAGFAGALLLLAGFGRDDLQAASSVLTPSTIGPSLGAAVLGLGWGLFESRRAQNAQAVLANDLEWADTISSSVLLAAVLIYCVLQAFVIPSGSMHNTLFEGDRLFVNKFLYGIRVPFTDKRVLKVRGVSRGDIIVFEFPSRDAEELHCGSPQAGKDFIKRAVALGGDTVQVKDGSLYVNGARPQEPYAVFADSGRLPGPSVIPAPAAYQAFWQSRRLDTEVGDLIRDDFGPVKVPEGSVFAMGDNRDRSCDSRFWGPVPERFLKGKAWFVYWPPRRAKLLD